MPKAKPYSGTVDAKLAAQLLNSTGIAVDDALPLGDALQEAATHLAGLVDRANEALEKNEFADIVAEHLANKMNRRGRAQIWVSETGGVMLDISYEEQPKRRVKPTRARAVPFMDELKARAEELGADISEFGIKRKKIHAFLEAVAAGEIEPPKKAKTSSSKRPRKPQVVQTADDAPEPDPGPMSAGPDETRVSAPPEEPKPPKRGFVKTSQAVTTPVVVGIESAKKGAKRSRKEDKPSESKEETRQGRSMRQLVSDASEVSITDLLSSDPPK